MQSTDLLDKNGKEIFEGDIVRSELHGLGTAEFVKYCTDSRWHPCIDSGHPQPAAILRITPTVSEVTAKSGTPDKAITASLP